MYTINRYVHVYAFIVSKVHFIGGGVKSEAWIRVETKSEACFI